VRLAHRDLPDHDLWYDDRDMNLDFAIDPNIDERLNGARVVIFCVGPSGLGPYQKQIELPLLQKRMDQAANGGPPLRLIPVLLPGGFKHAVPELMLARSVLNWDRSKLGAEDLWTVLKDRMTTDLAAPQTVQGGATGEIKASIDTLIDAVQMTSGLTVFIGAYGHAPDNTEAGEAAMLTNDYTNLMGWPSSTGTAAPWPSEAATWAGIADRRVGLLRYLQQRFAGANANPSDLMQSLSDLAEGWNKMAAQRNANMQSRNWRLLLLSTQLDQQLETCLGRKGLHFMRILPTADRNGSCRVEYWAAQNLPRGIVETTVRPERTALKDMTIDGMIDALKVPIDVVLVKLCGTLNDPGSVVISSADFLSIGHLMADLPADVLGWAKQNPLLMLGSGLSSPLALLVRSRLLPATSTESRPTIWVAPDEPKDILGRLEDDLLDLPKGVGVNGFRRALGLSEVVRGKQFAFVRELVNAL
jgi:hypothetical protein